MNDRAQQLKIIEAAIFAAGEPVNAERLLTLFDELNRPSVKEIKEMISEISAMYAERGVELIEVASGFRFQAKSEFAPWLQRLWEKKPPRYSRALLETLALVLYRQPITRGEIEDIRSVVVSTTIIKTLLDHNWIKIVGYKDVPGKPALYGSTKQFLDYFNLKNLGDLPALPEVTNLDALEQKLELNFGEEGHIDLVPTDTHDAAIQANAMIESETISDTIELVENNDEMDEIDLHQELEDAENETLEDSLKEELETIV